ncbi:hypothetical protein [Candidatus Nitrosocosmicus sp. R]
MTNFYSGYERMNEVYGLVESSGLPVISRPNQTKKILKQQTVGQIMAENQKNIDEWRKSE